VLTRIAAQPVGRLAELTVDVHTAHRSPCSDFACPHLVPVASRRADQPGQGLCPATIPPGARRSRRRDPCTDLEVHAEHRQRLSPRLAVETAPRLSCWKLDPGAAVVACGSALPAEMAVWQQLRGQVAFCGSVCARAGALRILTAWDVRSQTRCPYHGGWSIRYGHR
jgi:hypothetical protein